MGGGLFFGVVGVMTGYCSLKASVSAWLFNSIWMVGSVVS